MQLRQTGMERVEHRDRHAKYRTVQVDHRRAVDLVLSESFGRLAEEVRVIDAARVDWIDVTDGRFLPKISIRNPFIEVGGGHNCESAEEAIGAGANVIVVGSAIFGSSGHAAPIAAVRQRPRSSARKARS